MNATNEELSYIIGFLHGDGSYSTYSRNRGKISVELSKRDADILDKIQAIIIEGKRSGRTRNTNFKKDYISSIFTIHKKEIRDMLDLPVGKKCETISPPEWIDERHYIRGLCDADGSIGITSDNKPFWSLCTSSEAIKDLIINKMKDIVGIEKRLHRNKRDGVYNIVLYAEDAVEFASYTYKKATIYLDRKYQSFSKIMKWERTTPKRPGRKKIWLPEEDRIILSNLPIKDKIILLNRSKSSIATRLWRLGQLQQTTESFH
jgi:hypothetical protein